MIYSNIDVKSIEKTFDFGTISQIICGEEGTGRKLMKLTCPKDTEIVRGGNTLTIGVTKSGHPRINAEDDGKLYLLLSAKCGYTRRGNGTIRYHTSEEGNARKLAGGNGADGGAGRIGFWNVQLLEIVKDCTVMVVYGGCRGEKVDMVVCRGGKASLVAIEDYSGFCEEFGISPLDTDATDNWRSF